MCRQTRFLSTDTHWSGHSLDSSTNAHVSSSPHILVKCISVGLSCNHRNHISDPFGKVISLPQFRTQKSYFSGCLLSSSIDGDSLIPRRIRALIKDLKVVSRQSVMNLRKTPYRTPGYFRHIRRIHIAARIVLPHQAAHPYHKNDTPFSFRSIISALYCFLDGLTWIFLVSIWIYYLKSNIWEFQSSLTISGRSAE